MRPILFSIGSLNVYGYGLMFALGILAGVWLTMHLAKRRDEDADFIFNMAIYVVIFGFLGSKLLHLLTVLPELMEDPLGTLKSSITQGFVVYGSTIAGILTIIIYSRKHKKDMWKYTDLAMPGLALGQAIGRVGCLLAGCCYGIRYDGACAITFPPGSSAPTGIPLFPVQPLSAIANLLLMVVLLLYLKRNKIYGRVTALWMMLYSLGRGLIEIVRDDPRGNVGIFSTSQFISLILFVLGLALFIYLTKHKAALDPVLELDDEEDGTDYREDEDGEIDLVDLSPVEAAEGAAAKAVRKADDLSKGSEEVVEDLAGEAEKMMDEIEDAAEEPDEMLKDMTEEIPSLPEDIAGETAELADMAAEEAAKAIDTVDDSADEAKAALEEILTDLETKQLK
ncbi:MAG: prolipoprotein diacylglyceryl transferase [Lachnospiraceae bacterium]|nr:prolipoprotein diacylglyceryl transferase [Lachnospiraceae bacterium]